jgi:hypothetical protein
MIGRLRIIASRLRIIALLWPFLLGLALLIVAAVAALLH